MGGGLGGGSSDAATVLLVLNRLWRTGLSRQQLMELGLSLGADVPVFIFGRNAYARGIGEKLSEIKLPRRWYVVLNPGVQVPTAEIFSSPLLTRNSPPRIMPILETTQPNENDLQQVACALYPAIGRALEELSSFGSALMTGSGSCLFLECASREQAEKIFSSTSKKYDGFVAAGLDHHPLFDGD
jgi:4-diphosphocytidyl-2-C-methyl-D-erythritol kinase